jgi:hypothetical protein
MCSNLNLRLAAAFAAVLGLGVFSGVARTAERSAPQETVNCVAAIVDNQVISLMDVRVADAFGLFGPVAAGDAAERRRAVLEKLIDQKVVIVLARENVALDPAKNEQALAGVLAALGPDTAKQRLEEFGFAPADLLRVVEEKTLYEAIVSERFGRSAGVSLQEIERYYAETYIPEQKKLGLEPKPLIDVLPTIEETIKASKISARVAQWIKSLRNQTEIEVRTDCIK